MRGKSDIILEFVLGLITAYVVWYVNTGPGQHPAPLPWFWNKVNSGARRITMWSARKYRESIEGYVNG